jgi:outer membrane lipoprotein-sorting protein
MSWWRSGILFSAMCWGLAGCTTVSIPPVPETPAKAWEAQELIQSLSQRHEQFRSIKSLARVDYAGPDGKKGFQEAVLVERPDRLRLETLSLLGAIFVVTVNDREIVGYDPREGVWVRGQRTKENLLRLTKIPLEVNELTALLLGLPPVETRGTWQQNGNSLVFAAAGGAKDVVSFESAEPVPTKWQRINNGGTVELSATFSEYTSTPAGLFAGKIQLESTSQKRRLEIRYQSPELNVAIPAEVFSQKKPAHVTELPIEALGG